MTKRKLLILERAYEEEIKATLGRGIGLLQTRSKVAKKLEEEGLLISATVTSDGRLPAHCTGYHLTLRGRCFYWMLRGGE